MRNDLISPTYIEANVGDEVQIHCTAPGYYMLLVNWEFNQGHALGYVEFKERNVIYINPVHMNNSGSYTCYGWVNMPMGNIGFLAKATLKVVGELIIFDLSF